jgi:hypothetical protein
MYGAVDGSTDGSEMSARLRGNASNTQSAPKEHASDKGELHPEEPEPHDLTVGLSILAGAFERADEFILPAVFKGLERDLRWRPSQLGQLVSILC